MNQIRRIVAATTLTAAVMAGAVGPAAATAFSSASLPGDAQPLTSACTAATQAMADSFASLRTDLPVTNPRQVADGLATLRSSLTVIIHDGCVRSRPLRSRVLAAATPSVPPATTTPAAPAVPNVSACLSPLFDLLGTVVGLIGDALAVPPNVSALTTGLTGIVGSATKIVTCVTGGALGGVTGSLPGVGGVTGALPGVGGATGGKTGSGSPLGGVTGSLPGVGGLTSTLPLSSTTKLK